MLKEFKEFAMKGSMLDLAIGVVLGAAFGKIIDSLVKDLITPLIGLVTGGVDFTNRFVVLKAGPAGSYPTLADAAKDGAVVLGYGSFITAIIQFLLVAFALFLVVKGVNRTRRKAEEAPAAPPEPSREEVLLAEIRDALRSR
ncbi:MAG TPA: large conductance mechanosensitive channel protein MscL [Fimbriimonadaceae bacterium]|nr:large conductance mechanosensitive channel protein MscL [Fimbriimonadaceae bacterium]HRJ34301.1 large conductance mechanosensitive channel protein MscL [Fimbriimonadaceae bacterium]